MVIKNNIKKFCGNGAGVCLGFIKSHFIAICAVFLFGGLYYHSTANVFYVSKEALEESKIIYVEDIIYECSEPFFAQKGDEFKFESKYPDIEYNGVRFAYDKCMFSSIVFNSGGIEYSLMQPSDKEKYSKKEVDIMAIKTIQKGEVKLDEKRKQYFLEKELKESNLSSWDG